MPGAPPISVIICTRNRAGSLQRTLDSFLEIESAADRFELIVVDNGSTDDTAAVVSRFAAGVPFAVRYVLEKRRGVNAARNRGIATAAGDVMLWTDDDCIVAADWISTVQHCFANDLMKLVGGRVELFNRNDRPITIKQSLLHERLTSTSELFGFLHGCNMAFGRPVLERIGWFDVRFGPGTRLRSASETDFVYRALKSDIPVSYDPDIVVFHNHGRSTIADARRLMKRYQFGNGAIAMKYLLRGQVDLVKACYWQAASAFRRWREGRADFVDVMISGQAIAGAAAFLVFAAMRDPL